MEQKFLTLMQEDVLDTDVEIKMDMKLNDIEEWDSLSVVSFIATANTSFGKKVARQDVIDAETVANLYALVK
ncbi:MAG: hypothetical protein J6H31_15135 [Butyrivibrio sp.]|nr:hypothetical protein [Butyrivibrio sp.]